MFPMHTVAAQSQPWVTACNKGSAHVNEHLKLNLVGNVIGNKMQSD